MHKYIAESWAAALRSGEHKQGIQALENRDGKRCCLGVLCRVAIIQGLPLALGITELGDTTFDGSSSLLPEKLVTWAGIKEGNHNCGYNTNEISGRSLVTDNDGARKSFDEIADVIMEHYAEM